MASTANEGVADLPRPQGSGADIIIGPLWPEISIRELLVTFRVADAEAANFEARMQALPPQWESDDEDRASRVDRLTRFAQWWAPYSTSVAVGATRTHQLTLTAAVERFRTAQQLAQLTGEAFNAEAEQATAHAMCLQSAMWLSGVLDKANSVSPLISTDKEDDHGGQDERQP